MKPDRGTWFALLIGAASAAALVPGGVTLQGAVHGGLAALLAIGLVLTYQAHRFVHLGHAALGALVGSVVTNLVAHQGWNFWLAYPVGLSLGAVLGVASGMLLAERLANASRVVVVVASIGLAFAFGAATVAIGLRTGAVLRMDVAIPLRFELFPVRFSGPHALAAISVTVSLVLAWALLRRSDVGLRIRALAGDPIHAQRMGVDPRRTWRALWAFSGALAAAAGIATQPLVGTTLGSGPALGPLLPALAAAVVGRMRNLPLTVGAAIGLGIAQQAVAWYVPVAGIADVLLAVVIGVVLLLRPTVPASSERRDPAAWRFVHTTRPVRTRVVATKAMQITGVAMVSGIAVFLIRGASSGDAQRIGTIAVFALAALAVHVSASFGGRLSLGHWATAGVGLVVASIAGPAGIAGAFVAVGAGAATATLLALFSMRSGSVGYMTATFAFAAAFPFAYKRVQPSVGPGARFGPLSPEDPASTAAAFVVVVAIAVLATGAFRRSRWGAAALAVREDPRLATVHGVRIARTTLIVEALAGAIAGTAGFLYLWSQGTPHPDAFDGVRSLTLVAMAVLGGIGSVAGPVIGAVVVQGAQLFAEGPLYLLGTAAGILLIAVWLRGGIVSLVDVARSSTWRRPRRAKPAMAAGGARFDDAPSDETHKARRHPVVGRGATASLFAGTIAGFVVIVAIGGRESWIGVWIVVAIATACAAAAAAGYRIPMLGRGALATVVLSSLALVSGAVAYLIPISAGFVIGATLRVAGDGVPHSLRPAANGWVAIQAFVGTAAGIAIAVWTDASLPWIVALSLVLVVVAMTRSPVRTTETLPGTASDGLDVRDLTVRLGDVAVLDGSHLRVEPGRIVGIGGANGAGKSTLLRCIAGEVDPTSGSIVVGGSDSSTSSPHELARRGVVLVEAQHGSDGELSVSDNLALASMLATRRPDRSGALALATSLHPPLAEMADVRAAVLSGGERRLLALAAAMASNPRVLLADELGRGLADAQLTVLAGALRELASRGCAVVVVEHSPAFLARVADSVVHLHDGCMHDHAPVVGAHDGARA